MWGATDLRIGQCTIYIISIHAPRVGSDLGRGACLSVDLISIHAPRVGSDTGIPPLGVVGDNFNPRSPCGERRDRHDIGRRNRCISIHAPRVGSDLDGSQLSLSPSRFQSTLPVWGATVDLQPYVKAVQFQSTLPVWGATVRPMTDVVTVEFQSTLPVWGATML